MNLICIMFKWILSPLTRLWWRDIMSLFAQVSIKRRVLDLLGWSLLCRGIDPLILTLLWAWSIFERGRRFLVSGIIPFFWHAFLIFVDKWMICRIFILFLKCIRLGVFFSHLWLRPALLIMSVLPCMLLLRLLRVLLVLTNFLLGIHCDYWRPNSVLSF